MTTSVTTEIVAAKAAATRATAVASDNILLRQLRNLGCVLRGHGMIALVDQVVVSGTSFLTTVLVGRMGNENQLGIYSLAFTIVLGILCVQDSLVSLPYTVYGNRLHGEPRAEYAGSVLVHYCLLAVLAIVGLALSAMMLSRGIGPSRLAPVLWVLAGVIPFVLLRQFGRRFEFARLSMSAALALDAVVAIFQVGGLYCLAATGMLSAVTALAVVGAACAVGTAVWLVLARRSFRVRGNQVLPVLRRNWSFGRWIFAGQMSSILHAYALHWLLAALLGLAATGVFAACQAVVAFSNPFILGISNVLVPRAAIAFAEGGYAEVRRVVWKTTLVVSAAMVAFVGVVFLFGGQILVLFFGSEYVGHGHLVSVLALAALMGCSSIAVADGLQAIERADVNLVTNLLGLCVTLGSALLLMAYFHVLGAAVGLLAGCTVTSVVRCAVFFRLLTRGHRQKGNTLC